MDEKEESGVEELLAKAHAAVQGIDIDVARIQEQVDKIENLISAAETHGEAISKVVERVEGMEIDLQAKAETAHAQATEMLTAKTQVEDLQAVIAAKSDHIEQAQVHADKVRSNLDRLHTQATQKVGEAQVAAESAEAHAEVASEQAEAAKEAMSSVEADKAALGEAFEEIEALRADLKKYAANAERAEQKAAQYEQQLLGFHQQMQERIATIDGLLPGATSAGLATAFDERRKTFIKPSNRWQWVFVGALTVLVLIALSGLWHVFFAATPLTYDELFRLWLARFPIAGALVWLAIYASRESSLAKRLEEDYGYKAVVAASFQGFHKQMSDITERAGEGTPISKLCTDTLTTIGTPPGRIYDKHNLTVTPGSELTDLLKSVLAKGDGAEAKK